MLTTFADTLMRQHQLSACRRPSGADLAYVEELLAQIEAEGVPAPAPIEQCGYRHHNMAAPAGLCAIVDCVYPANV